MAKRVYLEDILIKKRKRLENKNYTMEVMNNNSRPSFYEALAKDGLSIIGEVKKASPSRGIIKEDFKPLSLAKVYENCVDAISVLTEEDYFLGKDAYLKEISNNVSIPTLCKDFILQKEQIVNAKNLGASCVLLIVAILSDEQLCSFIKTAESLNIDALVEVHNEEEVMRALKADGKIIGINNRDLVTFETTIETTLRLRELIPNDKIIISESGIHTEEDIRRLSAVNINGILVGESFMRAHDMKAHAKELKNAYQHKN